MSYSIAVKRAPNKESGASAITVFVFAVITITFVYCVYHILPFFYYFYELQNQMQSAIKVASLETDGSIREKLMYHINKMEIPMRRPEDLLIERDGNSMKISLPYEEVFYITWRGKDYDIHKFKFYAHAEGRF